MSTPLLKLRSEAYRVTPPDKFRFTVPEDGTVIAAFDVESWMLQIQNHYRFNGYELPENWRQIAEDQLCQKLDGSWCEYENGHEYEGGPSERFELGDILRGTEVLASFTLGGREVVPQEVAEQRAATCARCHMNVAAPGCFSCTGLLNVVAAVVGNHTTKNDQYLKTCMICKCSNKAQVHVAYNHLKKGTSPEQAVQFSRVPWCWKRDIALQNP